MNVVKDSDLKRTSDSDSQQDGKKIKLQEDIAPAIKNIYFLYLLEKMKFCNTPELKLRKYLACKAAEVVNGYSGEDIYEMYHDQHQKCRDIMLEGRMTDDKISKLKGQQIQAIGDTFTMPVKSLRVSLYIVF